MGGGLQRSPKPSSWFNGALLLRGRRGRREREEEQNREQAGNRGTAAPPFRKSLDPPLRTMSNGVSPSPKGKGGARSVHSLYPPLLNAHKLTILLLLLSDIDYRTV